MLIQAGHNVHWTHIEVGMDFFTEEPPKGVDYIISNPPYSLKGEVFERLFKLNIPFAMPAGNILVHDKNTMHFSSPNLSDNYRIAITAIVKLK